LIVISSTNRYLAMAEHSRALAERFSDDSSAFVHEVVTGALDHVPSAQHAGITVVRGGGQLQTAAASGTHPAVLDALQKRYKQGPCLDAAHGRSPIHVDDLSNDARWPLFRRDAVAQTPVRSSLSMPLLPDKHTTAALNVFAEHPQAFSAEAAEIASIYAIHAALAWSTVRAKNQLQRAMESRDLIGQAKGMLMERYGVSDGQAFALLKRLAQNSKISVAEVARRLAVRQPEEFLSAMVPIPVVSEKRRQEIRDATRC
jgi:transcriptional regulator with GAF, ATPase, and Fis domain